MTKQFLNRFDCKCDVCGLPIAIGEPITWNRRGAVRKRWHATCDGSKLETGETEIAKQDNGYTNGYNTEHESLKDALATTLEGGHTTLEDTLGIATKTAKTVSTGASNGVSAPVTGDWMTGFAGALLPLLEDKLNAKLDRAQVQSIVESMIGNAVILSATKVELKTAETGETKDLGIQHKSFPTLLQICNARKPNGRRLNVWLTGPTGSGKTTASRNVADALGLRFFHVGAMDNEYKLMGFIDAQGKVVNTLFKEWFTNGGIICLDEVDSWLPSATLALNGALANGHCTFPDGMVERHKDAVVIACANTWGLGATNDYVGRMKQDAAFLDRFVQLDWGYDVALETVIGSNPEWTKRVNYLRQNAKAKGLKVVISPRATEDGVALLNGGMAQELVEQLVVRKAMTSEQWDSIQ